MKQIKVKIGSYVDKTSTWVYIHSVLFPSSDFRSEITATSYGFSQATRIWEEAGYEIIFENVYPQ